MIIRRGSNERSDLIVPMAQIAIGMVDAGMNIDHPEQMFPTEYIHHLSKTLMGLPITLPSRDTTITPGSYQAMVDLSGYIQGRDDYIFAMAFTGALTVVFPQPRCLECPAFSLYIGRAQESLSLLKLNFLSSSSDMTTELRNDGQHHLSHRRVKLCSN